MSVDGSRIPPGIGQEESCCDSAWQRASPTEWQQTNYPCKSSRLRDRPRSLTSGIPEISREELSCPCYRLDVQVRYFLTVGLVGVLALSVASPALAEGPLPPRVTMNGKEWLTLTQQEFYENPRVQGMDKVLKEITAKPFRSKATYESEGDYSYEYITYDGRITRVAERDFDGLWRVYYTDATRVCIRKAAGKKDALRFKADLSAKFRCRKITKNERNWFTFSDGASYAAQFSFLQDATSESSEDPGENRWLITAEPEEPEDGALAQLSLFRPSTEIYPSDSETGTEDLTSPTFTSGEGITAVISPDRIDRDFWQYSGYGGTSNWKWLRTDRVKKLARYSPL